MEARQARLRRTRGIKFTYQKHPNKTFPMETSTPTTLSPLAKFRRDVAMHPNICRKIQPCEPPAPARICMSFQVSDAFAAEIDRARGFKSRSDFIRAAILPTLKSTRIPSLKKNGSVPRTARGKAGALKKSHPQRLVTMTKKAKDHKWRTSSPGHGVPEAASSPSPPPSSSQIIQLP